VDVWDGWDALFTTTRTRCGKPVTVVTKEYGHTRIGIGKARPSRPSERASGTGTGRHCRSSITERRKKELVTPPDTFAKLPLEIPADDKNHPLKPGAYRIEYRVIEKRFPGRTDTLQLLETAIAAAHSGGKDQKFGCHAKIQKRLPRFMQH